MIKDYFEKYKTDIFTKVYRNPLLEITKKGGGDPPLAHLSKVRDQLPDSIVDFYSSCNGILLEWQAKESTGIEAYGSIYFVELEYLFTDVVRLEDWKDGWRLNKDYSIPLQNLKGVFRHLDLFQGDRMVGVFSEEPSKEELYLYKSGACFESLKVDFDGYFQLLCKTYGFLDWQNVIIYREYGGSGSYGKYEHDEFKETMPQLFPDFDFDEFIDLYESLKIVD